MALPSHSEGKAILLTNRFKLPAAGGLATLFGHYIHTVVSFQFCTAIVA